MSAAAAPSSLQDALEAPVRRVLSSTQDIVSLAVGDRQGLPIVDATRGGASVMTFTAMATMSLRSATTAADAVGLPPPDHLVIHTPRGQVLVLALEADCCLSALLREGANLGLALLSLRRLAEELNRALLE